MTKKGAKLQSWQIFHAANKHLTPGVIATIFGKSNVRSAYSYGQDPAVTQHRCKDPIEAVRMMLERLDEVGRGDVAKAAIAYMATAIEEEYLAPVEDLQPTLELEMLKDFGAVASLQNAIENEMPVDVVDNFRHEAVEEIDRTFAKYVEIQGKRNR